MAATDERLEKLAGYSACDVSDILLALGVPGAGHLVDITPLNTTKKVAAPATTVLFVRRPGGSASFPASPTAEQFEAPAVASNIPAGAIYSDLITPGTIAVLSQPRGSATATMGSVHAVRMAKLRAAGVLVDGRVRDVGSLRRGDHGLDGLPVWCASTSIVATKAQCKAHAINVPVFVGDTRVAEGDIIFLDPEDNGAVCVPKDRLDQVLDMLPAFIEADNNQIKDLLNGAMVQEVSRKWSK